MSQLAERLQALSQSSRFPAEAVAALGDFLSGAPEEELFRMNPLAYGERHGLSEGDAIALFVHAARLGLCEFSWDVICVACGGVLKSAQALRNLDHQARCNTCDLSINVTLDDAVEVSFTVSPAVRPIRFHKLADLRSWEDMMLLVWSRSRALHPEAEKLLSEGARFADVLAPGESRRLGLDMAAGLHRLLAFREHATAELEIGEGESTALHVEIHDGDLMLFPRTAAAGPIHIELANKSRHFQPLVILQQFWGRTLPRGTGPTFRKFLTGKRLLTSQSFRDVFRAESISPGSSFDLREITFMFTDLKGSTELYDRIGDLEAYRLVREHFHILERIVAAHEGAIVKTIGDAIMATFSGARDAVEAALEMHDRMEEWNGRHEAGDLLLKIGIHDGPCIAVDSNDRLDYFGQTVNMAARIQGLAQARETYFSDSVYGAPGVEQFVRGRGMDLAPVMTSLKGISEEVSVFRMPTRLHNPRSPASED